jgi:hypothetical protein
VTIAEPLGVVEVDPSKLTMAAAAGLGGEKVNAATGEAGGVTAATETLIAFTPVRPLVSVTLSPALYVPMAVYTCDGLASAELPPSPNVHRNELGPDPAK